jgi:Flp pilus assembly protein TadB
MAVVGLLLALAAALLASGGTRPRPMACALAGSDPGDEVARPTPRDNALLLRDVGALGAAAAVLLLVPGTAGPPVSVVVGVLVWRRSGQWEGSGARRRRARVDADLPHVVDLLVATVTVGADPGDALGRVSAVVGGPTADELSVWVHRLRLGSDPVSVWADMARHPQLGRLGTTLRRSAESGAPVASALRRLSADLRDRQRAEVESRVRQVEVKSAVPLGVCLLPAFVLVGVVPLVAGSALGFLATT